MALSVTVTVSSVNGIKQVSGGLWKARWAPYVPLAPQTAASGAIHLPEVTSANRWCSLSPFSAVP